MYSMSFVFLDIVSFIFVLWFYLGYGERLYLLIYEYKAKYNLEVRFTLS